MRHQRSRRGPVPKEASQLRRHCVSVRMSKDELSWLDSERLRVGMRRGEYLRCAAMNARPPVIPEINRQAWAALGRLTERLTEIFPAENMKAPPVDVRLLEDIRALLKQIRIQLISGGRHES